MGDRAALFVTNQLVSDLELLFQLEGAKMSWFAQIVIFLVVVLPNAILSFFSNLFRRKRK
jgi:hypothetical protein